MLKMMALSRMKIEDGDWEVITVGSKILRSRIGSESLVHKSCLSTCMNRKGEKRDWHTYIITAWPPGDPALLPCAGLLCP